MIFRHLLNMQSHPTWVRGLKLRHNAIACRSWRSHPTWVRGLKRYCVAQQWLSAQSHPTWVRGLKHRQTSRTTCHGTSHPTWVRGLKPKISQAPTNLLLVAPYVGAWIETSRCIIQVYVLRSHPTWVRGLKLAVITFASCTASSHPTWVRGLKHTTNQHQHEILGRTLRGCVD